MLKAHILYIPVMLAGLIGGISGCTTKGKPPTNMLTQTEVEIQQAAGIGANEHAPAELRAARNKLEEAKTAIDEKEYEEAERLLQKASVNAEYAMIKTQSIQTQSAADAVHANIETLQKELDRLINEQANPIE